MKWPENIIEAGEEQERRRRHVRLSSVPGMPEYVAGVDAAFSEDTVFAAACLFRYRDLVLVEQKSAVRQISFPYVPALFAFREGPAIIAAIEKLSIKPDMVLIDG